MAATAEPEDAIYNFPWTQNEMDKALTKCRGSHRAWRAKKPRPTLQAVTNEEGRPLDDVDESGTRLWSYRANIFKAREVNYQDHSCGPILNCAHGAQEKFDDVLATKESARGPVGFP